MQDEGTGLALSSEVERTLTWALVWVPSPLLGLPCTDSPRGPREVRGQGTCLHTRPSLVRDVLSGCAPAPHRQGNCTLELQSNCLAQQLNEREMEQKQLNKIGPGRCRGEGDAHTRVQGLGVGTLIHAHSLPLCWACLLLHRRCLLHVPASPCPLVPASPCPHVSGGGGQGARSGLISSSRGSRRISVAPACLIF